MIRADRAGSIISKSALLGKRKYKRVTWARPQGGGKPVETHTRAGRGSGYRVRRETRARPSNTSVRDLLSDDWYTEAVPSSLTATRVGAVKEGVIKCI